MLRMNIVLSMADETQVRKIVLQHLNGELTEAEAAQRAGLSRAQFRRYVRTCGVVAPTVPADESEPTIESNANRADERAR